MTTNNWEQMLIPNSTPDYYFLKQMGTEEHADLNSVERFFRQPIFRQMSRARVEKIRMDFPYFSFRDNPIWFDNGATTQKPELVIDTQSQFYREHYSNINRGAHRKAVVATEMYETARKSVADFLGAKKEKNIIFVRGTTEGVNLLANSLGALFFKKQENKNILLMEYEHHANLVPWQMMAKSYGGRIFPIPCDKFGDVDLEAYATLLQRHSPCLVALAHVSNALGTIAPVKQMTRMAHDKGALVILDGAQAVPHMSVDMQDIDCDFYAFSGHKLFGPTGVGAIYGRESILEQLPPWQFGGNMIEDVSFERTTFNTVPARFEAGTPAIAEAIGLKAAIDYIQCIGYEWISLYEDDLMNHLVAELSKVEGVHIVAQPKHRASILSMIMPGKDDQSFARFLDKRNIALRVGHHCAIPALRCFGLSSTIRVSLAFYNTFEEIDTFVDVCKEFLYSYRMITS
jgi:cysteine desulfurase/selenocysteine lyase